MLVQIHLLIDELSALTINVHRSMITIQTYKATVAAVTRLKFAVAGVTRLNFAVLTVGNLRKLR